MLRLLERSIARIERRLVLLAPPTREVPSSFKQLTADGAQHQELAAAMQRLRGSVYLRDGAVRPEQLSRDGAHRTAEDEKSWHLLMLTAEGKVSSCAWFLEHPETARFEHLRVKDCPLARQDGWRDRLSRAVESELARARRERLSYAEVGGWAVAEESRCTSEGLVLALAAYSLGRTLGGALGITTATVRHASSSILRRLGGAYLEVDGVTVPPYYDPKYDCQMELLRFDSRQPSRKFGDLVESLREKLADVPVIAADRVSVSASYALSAQPQFAA